MGNTVYLSKMRGEHPSVQFEMGNAAPLFWMCLLDLESLKHITVRFSEEEDGDADAQPETSVTIQVPRGTVLRNLDANRAFIAQYCPDRTKLYNDFREYLDCVSEEGEAWELDFSAIAANFYAKPEDFVHDTCGLLQSIASNTYEEPCSFMYGSNDSNDDGNCADFYAFTGWAEPDSTFAEHSAEYAKSLADYQKTSDEFRRQAELARKKRSAKEKGTNLFLCVGGAAFAVLSVLMIASGRGIAIRIVGLLFGGIGVFMGVSNLRG